MSQKRESSETSQFQGLTSLTTRSTQLKRQRNGERRKLSEGEKRRRKEEKKQQRKEKSTDRSEKKRESEERKKDAGEKKKEENDLKKGKQRTISDQIFLKYFLQISTIHNIKEFWSF